MCGVSVFLKISQMRRIPGFINITALMKGQADYCSLYNHHYFCSIQDINQSGTIYYKQQIVVCS